MPDKVIPLFPGRDQEVINEAILNADSYLNNVDIPNYSQVVTDLTALQRAAERALFSLKRYSLADTEVIDELETALSNVKGF